MQRVEQKVRLSCMRSAAIVLRKPSGQFGCLRLALAILAVIIQAYSADYQPVNSRLK